MPGSGSRGARRAIAHDFSNQMHRMPDRFRARLDARVHHQVEDIHLEFRCDNKIHLHGVLRYRSSVCESYSGGLFRAWLRRSGRRLSFRCCISRPDLFSRSRAARYCAAKHTGFPLLFAAGFGPLTFIGIWVKWRLQRCASRGVANFIFAQHACAVYAHRYTFYPAAGLQGEMMRSAIKVLFAVFAIFVASPVLADPSDGTKVVLTLSAAPGISFGFFTLWFRSADGSHSFTAQYGQDGWFRSKRDFDDAQGNGTVEVHDLAPGDWMIYSFTFRRHGPVTPLHDFAIPFSIKKGQAVYLGDFRVSRLGNGNEIPDPGGHDIIPVSFTISDQGGRDIAIAQSRDKNLGTVQVAVPEVPPGTPYFTETQYRATTVPPTAQPSGSSKTP